MARPFQYSMDRRIVNRIIIWLLKFGLAPRIYSLLIVTGRITGNPHSVPVVLVVEGNKSWLVAPYGEIDWVKNTRASGKVKLSRRKRSEDFAIRELPPEEAAPILKKYLEENSLTKPYFDARVDSSLVEFVEEARSRPVFELIKI
ncbi:MAG: nitroreductase family deazaflavin-dependent oxidoreductase [Anaerolineales bacterium]|nr:nitroreductase family deazaflavin-dependent oxidoreductase [Anaerolineales bacterium]